MRRWRCFGCKKTIKDECGRVGQKSYSQRFLNQIFGWKRMQMKVIRATGQSSADTDKWSRINSRKRDRQARRRRSEYSTWMWNRCRRPGWQTNCENIIQPSLLANCLEIKLFPLNRTGGSIFASSICKGPKGKSRRIGWERVEKPIETSPKAGSKRGGGRGEEKNKIGVMIKKMNANK